MYYLLSYSTVDQGMRWPTTKYREFIDVHEALAHARSLLLVDGIAVHIEPMEG